MRTIRIEIALSVLLAPVVFAADYCPLNEGNEWTYSVSNGSQMTVKVAGFANVGAVRCAIVETVTSGQTTREYVTADAEGLKMHASQMQGPQFRYDPPVARLKLPYKQGDRWTALVNQLGRPTSTTFESLGREQVQTPAGTFDCIKVRTTVMGTPPTISTIYYADGVGPVQQVVQTVGQALTAKLVSTNVKPAKEAPVAAEPNKPTVDANKPAMEKYQSADGKVLLYRPPGWPVNQGDMFGQGTYGVTVTEPKENATVLFITFPVNDQIKDSVMLAAKYIGALRAKYPDLQATSINSTQDRARTLAGISLTAEGEKGVGHGYFIRTQDAGSVYILLAKAAAWDRLRPTLTTIAANLAYAPQGVATVLEQGKRLAEQKAADSNQAPTLSPAAMLQRAARLPGKQVKLQTATLPDQSMSIDIPQGWTLKGQKLQYTATSNEQTHAQGMCSMYHTIMPSNRAIPGVINERYQTPRQALDTALWFAKLGKDLEVLAEIPTETAVPGLVQMIQQQRARGFQVDSQLMHVRFKNVLTGAATRGIFVVQCSIKPSSPTWQLTVNGSWAPDSEYEQWLPVFVRMGKTSKANPQSLNQSLQDSTAESTRAFDRYMDSVRDAGRGRDYTNHIRSQTTLGQGSWVAESEGAEVYQTDSWGIEGPEGRVDNPAYNTTNFSGENPWTDTTLHLVNTRAEYEKYIANQ
jgi:hypothetical protein